MLDNVRKQDNFDDENKFYEENFQSINTNITLSNRYSHNRTSTHSSSMLIWIKLRFVTIEYLRRMTIFSWYPFFPSDAKKIQNTVTRFLLACCFFFLFLMLCTRSHDIFFRSHSLCFYYSIKSCHSSCILRMNEKQSNPFNELFFLLEIWGEKSIFTWNFSFRTYLKIEYDN